MRELDERSEEGWFLNRIGLIYHYQGRHAEALDAYRQALPIMRETGDREGAGVMLSDIGEVCRTLGRYTEALDAYHQALPIKREMGDGEGVRVILDRISAIYRSQARYEEALEVYGELLAEAREAGDLKGEGVTLNNIGAVCSDLGRYAEALDALQQALALLREMDDRMGEGVTLANIGAIYASQGRYGEALDEYQQALAIQREVGDRAGEGTTLHNIGTVRLDQGRYGEAQEAYQQALMILREVGDREREGMTINSIGGVYQYQGRYNEALEAYQQALAVRREVGDRTGEGITLGNIGAAYDSLGRYADALEAYHQALAILREVGDRDGEGVMLSNIGAFYESRERYAEALESLQQALAIRREIGDRPGEGATLTNIGAVYDDQGRYTEALEAYQQALSILREVGARDWEGSVLVNIGDVYRQQGQPDQALAYYEQAMMALEALRVVAGSEAGRAGFIAQHAGMYDRAVGLYHQQGKNIEAFQTSDRGRARAFLDTVTTGYVELADDQAADLLARERETYAGWQAAQDALLRARAAEPFDYALVADLQARLAAVENDHTAVLAAIQARGDQLAALVPGRSAVLSLPEVQALLDADTTLIAYHILSDASSLAFVITTNDMQVVELPGATPENILRVLNDLYAWRSLENPHPSPLQNLYDWLVMPLAAHLKTYSVALISPHQLHYVPFVALTDGERYLGERHELSILPSASSLRFIRQNAAAPDGTGALIFGNPTSDVPGWEPLEYAEQEASDVARLLGASAFVGEDATEAQLRAASSGARVVHLAAHGSYNDAYPLYSTIYLAPDDRQDGRLEAHEIYGLDLKGNEVVVLSACETNIGKLSVGDEVVGLTRAFFFAGAPTVISSLWSVDDAATGVLMTAFYRHWLQDGMSKAQALQAAQADVRNDPRWVSPFFWAGFVLNGDPGRADQTSPSLSVPPSEEKTTSSNPAAFVICLVALLVTTAGIILFLRRRHHQ